MSELTSPPSRVPFMDKLINAREWTTWLFNLRRAVFGRMKWAGAWEDDGYKTNDVVVDGLWTMVCIDSSGCTDRASPQPVGAPEHSINQSQSFTTQQNISVVKQIHKITLAKSGFIELLQVRAPVAGFGLKSRVTFINITNSITTVVDNPVLNADAWTTLALVNKPFHAGIEFEIWFELYNSDVANEVSGIWHARINNGVPDNGEMDIDSNTVTSEVLFDNLDDDGVDRRTELIGVGVGALVRLEEIGDIARSLDLVVNSIDSSNVNYVRYLVSVQDVGSKTIRDRKDCQVNISPAITVPTDYSVASGYFNTQPTFAQISTSLEFDGVPQAVSQLDAYGIDIRFQEATISPQWDYMAYSG